MYYGSHKISKVRDIHDGFVMIEFEPEKDADKKTIEIPSEVTSKEVLEAVRTEEEKDATYIRDQRLQVMKNNVMNVLAYHNMYTSEWPKVAESVQNLLVDAIEQADEIAWKEPNYRKSIYSCNQLLKTRFEK